MASTDIFTPLDTRDIDRISIASTIIPSKELEPTSIYHHDEASFSAQTFTSIRDPPLKWPAFITKTSTSPNSKSSFAPTPALAAVSTAIFLFIDSTFSPRNTGVITPNKLSHCHAAIADDRRTKPYPCDSPTLYSPITSPHTEAWEEEQDEEEDPPPTSMCLKILGCLAFSSPLRARKRKQKKHQKQNNPSPTSPSSSSPSSNRPPTHKPRSKPKSRLPPPQQHPGLTLPQYLHWQAHLAATHPAQHMAETREMLFFIHTQLTMQELWRRGDRVNVQRADVMAAERVIERCEYVSRRDADGRSGWDVWADGMGWWEEVVVERVFGWEGAREGERVVEGIPGMECWA